MNWFFLFFFWTGIFLLLSEEPYTLLKRAEALSGKAEEKGRKAFLVLTSKIRAALFRETVEREISDSLGYIRNIAMTGDSSVSALSLLSDLAGISDKLRPVYLEMERHLSVGDGKKAEECFVSNTGLSISKGLAELIAGWDEADPSEMSETADSYISLLREERITAQKRKNEILSDLIYFPVVVNCMLVLINFIYISFFVSQRELLTLMQ